MSSLFPDTYTSITNISIADGVTTIMNYAFKGCSSLCEINLGNSVMKIGNQAFYGCLGLTSITIPACVTSLGSYVFGKSTVSTQSSICPLKTVYLTEGSPLNRGSLLAAGMRSSAKVRIRANRKVLGAEWVFYVDSSDDATIEGIIPPVDGSLRIPEDFDEWPVVGIEKAAFANCTAIKTLMIPAGVTSIGDKALIHCTGLKTLFLHRDCVLSESVIRSSVRLVDTCEIVRWTSTGLPVIRSAEADRQSSSSAIVRVRVDFLGADNASVTVSAKIAGIAEASKNVTGSGTVELTLGGIPNGRDYTISVKATAPSGLSDARSVPLSMPSNDASGQNVTPHATKYTIAFNASGGTGKMATQTMTYGKAAELSANKFTRKGYVFAGWAKKKGGAIAYTNAQSVKNLRTDGKTTTLYAVWAKPTYKVAFYGTYKGVTGKMATQSFTYGKAKKLSANKFKRKGYVFKGWAKSAALAKKGKVAYANKKSVKNLVTNGKPVKLYAVWKKK